MDYFFVTITFTNIFLVYGVTDNNQLSRPIKPCRFAKEASLGEITSPSFPSPYPDHADCLYYVKAPSGPLKLTFLQFDVDGQNNCTSDYVQVYNFREWSPRLCGNTRPRDFHSPDGDMYVFFYSDDFQSGRGWKASFSQVSHHEMEADQLTPTFDSVTMNSDSSPSSEVTQQS